MNNFLTLMGFEYKKIFLKKSVVMALSVAFALNIVSCFAMVIGNSNSDYYSEGMSNWDAMQMDKASMKALSGRKLDATLILEASAAYQKMDENVTSYTKTENYKKFAKPYSGIYTLIDSAYANSGNAFNIDDFQNLSAEDADNYYVIRETQLRENLTNNPLFSETDVDYILSIDKSVKKPFILEYTDGYDRFFALSVTTMMIILVMVSFIVSPIFSDEYSKNTAALILTSKNGKKHLLYAKIFTAISIGLIVTLTFSLSSYFVCMGIYGFDGTNSQIQLLIPLLPYNFTFIEATIIIIITSFMGGLLQTTFCLAISSVSKNSIIPMSVGIVFIILGIFNMSQIPIIKKLGYLLPLNLGNFHNITLPIIFNLFSYKIFLYQASIMTGLILSLIFLMLSVRAFKQHEVL